ncbi:hypothetical protein ACET3Z_025238 [Daucus carota]
MRGRLRVDGRVFGENPSWLEVPFEYWSKRLLAGSDAPVIPDPILAPGDETPKYGEDSRFFTIKVHYGRRFDDNMDSYVGGEIRYFDMCEVVDFCLIDMESMLTELGYLNIYTTHEPLDEVVGDGWDEFSLTQLAEDQRIEMIEEMREEVGYVGEPAGDNEGVNPSKKEEEQLSWEGDNSNLDSSDSEVEKVPPKRRRICHISPFQIIFHINVTYAENFKFSHL